MTDKFVADDHTIVTERLMLRAATVADLRAAAENSRSQLAILLKATVASDWPPALIQDAFAPIADSIEASKGGPPWSMYWVMLQQTSTLIGTVGFKAPPNAGQVDIGYTIVATHQRQGYASEAAGTLINFAFRDPTVDRVVAETLADLIPSIRVMEKVGMHRVEDFTTGFSGEQNVVRYQISRTQHDV